LTPFEEINEAGVMSQLTVIAKLKAKSGAEEKLYEECRKLIAPTLAEEGCINYDMYRSTEDSGTFMFYENWASRPHWERHMESPHLKTFPNNTEGMVEVWELFLGEKVVNP
jgi:quinol monooxygenase YgiN